MLTKQEAQPTKDVVRNERQPGASERAIASLQQETGGRTCLKTNPTILQKKTTANRPPAANNAQYESSKKRLPRRKLKAEQKWTASSRLCTVDSETPMQQQTSSFSLRQRKQDSSFNSQRGKEKVGRPWPMEKPTLKPTENQSTNEQDRITVKKKMTNKECLPTKAPPNKSSQRNARPGMRLEERIHGRHENPWRE